MADTGHGLFSVSRQRRIGFVFPGVGVPLCGREVELADRYPAVFWPLVATASARVGLDLEAALRSGATLELPAKGEQALGYAFSVGCARAFHQCIGAPLAVSGYSFGIYAAVTTARGWGYEDGLEILLEAERIMASLLPPEPCGLAVVLGLDAASVASCVSSTSDLAVVNRNTEQCFVLAGTRAALETACVAASECGAISAKLLPVSVPYHHPRILADAAGLLASFLRRFDICPPSIPVISSMNGERLLSAPGIAQYAAANLSWPCDWLSALFALDEMDTTLVLECGLGLSLSQSARFVPLRAEQGNCRNYARFFSP